MREPRESVSDPPTVESVEAWPDLIKACADTETEMFAATEALTQARARQDEAHQAHQDASRAMYRAVAAAVEAAKFK